jgi:hypothetical protein
MAIKRSALSVETWIIHSFGKWEETAFQAIISVRPCRQTPEREKPSDHLHGLERQ